MIVELKNGETKQVNSIFEIKDQDDIKETYHGTSHTTRILRSRSTMSTHT